MSIDLRRKIESTLRSVFEYVGAYTENARCAQLVTYVENLIGECHTAILDDNERLRAEVRQLKRHKKETVDNILDASRKLRAVTYEHILRVNAHHEAADEIERLRWIIYAEYEDNPNRDDLYEETKFEARRYIEDENRRISGPEKWKHLGDPCIYCGQPHDEVAVGPCPGRDVEREKKVAAGVVDVLTRIFNAGTGE